MLRYLVLAAMLAITGCSTADNSLGMFVRGDLMNAGALAALDGDAPAAACYTELGQDVAPTPTPAADGLFVVFQRKRELQAALTSGKCSPLVGQLLLDIGRRVPFVGIAVP